MDERVIQFRVGVMVLATIIITLILVLLFGERQALFQAKQTYYIKFPEATGVSRNSPIQLSGIVIGRVTDVQLAEDNGALITAEIDSKYQIRQNQVCRIGTSLLGDATLRFVRSNDPSMSNTPVPPGSTISGVVAPDPIQIVSDMQQRLAGAIGSVTKTSEDLDVVVRRIGGVLQNNEQRLDRIIVNSDETMAMLRKSVANFNEFAADPELKEKIRQTIEGMPEVLRESRDTLRRMSETFGVLDQNLRNVEGLTRPLGERGESLVGRLDESMRKFDLAMDQMVRFSSQLNNSEGSLGQLVHNPDLYNNLNQAASNIQEITVRLRPILDDARVFSDKIARHPEVLGVRGALEKRPGIK